MPERNESILDFSSQILILLDLTKLYSLQLSPSKYETEILTLTCFSGTSKNLSQFSTKSYSVFHPSIDSISWNFYATFLQVFFYDIFTSIYESLTWLGEVEDSVPCNFAVLCISLPLSLVYKQR